MGRDVSGAGGSAAISTIKPLRLGGFAGRMYADEIFSLGPELLNTIRGHPTGRPTQVVGVADVLPKSIAHWLIEPALHLSEPVRIVCREASTEQLLSELGLQHLDVVLADAPIGPEAKVRAYRHLLGETSVSFLAVPRLARALRHRFPGSLRTAPLLLPAENTAIRRSLDDWFDSLGIRPDIHGEFEDSALLWEFARAGDGVFPTPSVLESHLRRLYGLERVGRTNAVRGRFYAISPEQRLRHPAVVAICRTARRKLFKTATMAHAVGRRSPDERKGSRAGTRAGRTRHVKTPTST